MDAAPHARTARARRGPALLVALLTLLLACPGLGRVYDGREIFTAELVSRSFGSMWQVIARDQANMSFYYVLAWPWRAVLGNGELALRSLSALFAAGAAAAVWLLAERLWSARAAWIASLLLVGSGWFLHFAQHLTSYSLVMLLVAAGTLVLLRAMESSGQRWWLLYGVVMALAVYAHFYAALVIAAHAVLLVVQRRVRAASPAHLLMAALITPLVWFVVGGGDTGQISWIQRPTAYAVGHAARQFSGGSYALAVFNAVVVGWAGWEIVRGRRTWQLLLVTGWAVLPVVVSLAVSLLVKPVFNEAYLTVSLPALALLGGWLVGQLASRVQVAAWVLLALLLAGTVAQLYRADYRSDTWHGAVAEVGRDAKPGDQLSFVPAYNEAIFGWYYDRTGRPGGFTMVADPCGGAARRIWVVGDEPGCLAAADYRPSTVVTHEDVVITLWIRP